MLSSIQGSKAILTIIALGLAMIKYGEGACYSSAVCGGQPAWVDITVECDISTKDGLGAKKLEDQLKQLHNRLDHLMKLLDNLRTSEVNATVTPKQTFKESSTSKLPTEQSKDLRSTMINTIAVQDSSVTNVTDSMVYDATQYGSSSPVSVTSNTPLSDTAFSETTALEATSAAVLLAANTSEETDVTATPTPGSSTNMTVNTEPLATAAATTTPSPFQVTSVETTSIATAENTIVDFATTADTTETSVTETTEATDTSPPSATSLVTSIEESRYIGMKSGVIPNSAVTASSYYGRGYESFRARLDNQPTTGNTGSWSAKQSRAGEWWQVDIGSVKKVAGLITQGRPKSYNQWVKSYKVSCGKTPTTVKVVRRNGTDTVFQGNIDKSTKVYNEFPEPLFCRYIRIYPQSWNNHISMRVELVAAENSTIIFTTSSHEAETTRTATTKTTYLETSPSYATTVAPSLEDTTEESCYMGMKSGLIPNSAITASSFWGKGHEPYQARLDGQHSALSSGIWAAKTSKVGEWLQVDFGSLKEVAGVISQGRANVTNQWVTSFKVECTGRTRILRKLQENGRDKVFQANNDRNTKVYNRFPNVMQCRTIRIYPQAWLSHISMRVEFVSGSCFNKTDLWSPHCESSFFNFWKPNHLDYVYYNGTLPKMTSFTACVWVSPSNDSSRVKGSIFSYCTAGTGHCNTVVAVLRPTNRRMDINIRNTNAAFKVPPITALSHLCIMMSRSTRKVHYFVNGTQPDSARKLNKIIPAGGVLILGQDQDSPVRGQQVGAAHQSTDGFFGQMEGFLLWNRALRRLEINNMYQSRCNCETDAIVTFTSENSIPKGHVTADWTRICSIASNASTNETSTITTPMHTATEFTTEQMTTIAGTTVATDESCYMGMISGLIPNSAITASTLWSKRHMPYQGRLNNKKTSQSDGIWAAKTNKIGEWLQVDFGRVKEIAGIITQGRPKDANQWVRTFKVKCNELEQRFETVQENGHDKIFKANNDGNTKVYNRFSHVFRCRRIRIFPVTWSGHISMRVEFVSGRCFDNETLWISTRYMGMKSGVIPNSAITASSYFSPGHKPFRARLDNRPTTGNTGSWSARTNRVGEWWQVDLGSVKKVAGITTQGRPKSYNQWVKTYTVSCGTTLSNATMIRQNGTSKIFQANNDKNTKVYNRFPEPLLCRYVRIYPQTWNNHISMRVEIVAAENDTNDFASASEATETLANRPTDATHIKTLPTETTAVISSSTTNASDESCYMGMKSGHIPNSAITASTYWGAKHEPDQARLDNQYSSRTEGAWSAKLNAVGQWIQVDLGSVVGVAGVVSQGRPDDHNQWVRTFKVSYRALGKSFVTVMENGRDKIFRANNDMETKVYNRFPEVIRCRTIRIYPLTWNNHISMRLEFISERCFNDTALWAPRCRSTVFTFSNTNHLDYVKYDASVPRLNEYTACAWVSPIEGGDDVKGVILSYCTLLAKGCNTIQIKLDPIARTVRVITKGNAIIWNNVAPITTRSHVCFVLSKSTKKMHYYVNGTQPLPAKTLTKVIPGSGTLIIGQDQDGVSVLGGVGKPQQPEEGFQGKIDNFLLWDRALTSTDINDLYQSGCNCAVDATIYFDSENSITEGHVRADFNQICYKQPIRHSL